MMHTGEKRYLHLFRSAVGRVERDQLKYNKIRTKDKFVDQFNYWSFTLLEVNTICELWPIELWFLSFFKLWYYCDITLLIITYDAILNQYIWSFQIITRTSPWVPRCPRTPRRTSSASTLRKPVGGSLKNAFKIFLKQPILSGVLELLTKSLVQLYEVR